MNGNSINELVSQAAAHAVEGRGCTTDLVQGAEWREQTIPPGAVRLLVTATSAQCAVRKQTSPLHPNAMP